MKLSKLIIDLIEAKKKYDDFENIDYVSSQRNVERLETVIQNLEAAKRAIDEFMEQKNAN